jgi:hypothetical protein
MVALMDGKSIVERIKDEAERRGHACKGPVGVVSTFSKEMRVDQPNRDVVAVATTDDLDLEEEVVVPGGADTTYFKNNRKVFVDHEYGLLNAVGVLRNLKKWRGTNGADGWLARVHVPESPDNPLASHVLALAAAEGIGMSIGFEAMDFGRPTTDESKRYPGAKSIVREWRWLELSFTALPCNVACQSQGMTTDTSKAARTREFLTKSNAPASVFRLLHLDWAVMEIPVPLLEIA